MFYMLRPNNVKQGSVNFNLNFMVYLTLYYGQYVCMLRLGDNFRHIFLARFKFEIHKNYSKFVN